MFPLLERVSNVFPMCAQDTSLDANVESLENVFRALERVPNVFPMCFQCVPNVFL